MASWPQPPVPTNTHISNNQHHHQQQNNYHQQQQHHQMRSPPPPPPPPPPAAPAMPNNVYNNNQITAKQNGAQPFDNSKPLSAMPLPPPPPHAPAVPPLPPPQHRPQQQQQPPPPPPPPPGPPTIPSQHHQLHQQSNVITQATPAVPVPAYQSNAPYSGHPSPPPPPPAVPSFTGNGSHTSPAPPPSQYQQAPQMLQQQMPPPPPNPNMMMHPPPPPAAGGPAQQPQMLRPPMQMPQQQYGQPPPPPNPNMSHQPPPGGPPQHQQISRPQMQNGMPQQQYRQPPPPQQQRQQQQPKPKIDPSQIPRPPLFIRPQGCPDINKPIPIYYPRKSLNTNDNKKALLPPPADSRFVTVDDGNAAPQLLRSTVYAMPKDSSVVRKTGIDMGILSTPLAFISQDYIPRQHILPLSIGTKDQQQQPPSYQTNDGNYSDDDNKVLPNDPHRIPVTYNYNADGSLAPPPRCPRCNVYANPFWSLECNFCRTRHGYRQGSQPQYGTIEYEVGGPYITREQPVEPIRLYAIDATLPNIPTYIEIIKNVATAITQHWKSQPHNYGQQQSNGGPTKENKVLKPKIGCCLVACTGLYIVQPQVNKPAEEFTMYCMADITDDPFCPRPISEWAVDISTDDGLNQFHYVMDKTLETLQPTMLDDLRKGRNARGLNTMASSCGGAALAAMADALSETGGRVTWISHRRPNYGVGAIRDREQKKLQKYTTSQNERPFYTPLQQLDDESNTIIGKEDMEAATFYKNLGKDCSTKRICIDICLVTQHSTTFLDIATLSELCRTTCGKLKWIRGANQWEEQLQEELCRSAVSFSGSDAIFKVRCSDGLQVKSFMSTTNAGVTIDGGLTDSPELELSMVTPNTCIAVLLEHKLGGIPKSLNIAFVQTALLYTTATGRRRVRVSTLGIRISSDPSHVFRSADFSAVTALLTRQAISHVWDVKSISDQGRVLRKGREDAKERCVKMLSNYRLNTNARSSPIGQLILPETLQLLPLFCMSLVKSAMLRPSLPKRESGMRSDHPSPNGDERAYALHYGMSVLPAMAMLLVHPNVFCLNSLGDGAGDWQIPNRPNQLTQTDTDAVSYHPFVKLPNTTHASITLLADDGIYIIDNGLKLFIYLGSDVPDEVRNELLENTDNTQPTNGSTVSTSSDFGQRILRVIWQIRTFSSIGAGTESVIRPTYAPIIVVKGGQKHRDPNDEEVMKLMVDDSISSEDDYVDFLCSLHRRIRQKVEDES